jgi:RNA polymerase sigma-70 factor (ECF subfamily)
MEVAMHSGHAISAALSERRLSSSETDDEMLLRLIAAGDHGAMRVLFARHRVRVFRFLVRIVGDHVGLAEDLVSETFLEVWRRASQFEGRSQALTWMLGIARHKALSARRRRSFNDKIDGSFLESIEDPADNPEVSMQSTDLGAILRECIKQLSSEHREVIDLVYYHEQSIDEASRIVGVPPNTVKSRMFYARKCIARMMADRGIDRDCCN